jgi:hypothetical protein
MKKLKNNQTTYSNPISLDELKLKLGNPDDITDMDTVLIKLPNNMTVTFEEYIDDNWCVKYSIMENHTESPMNKPEWNVPAGWGSKCTKYRHRYWENL